MTYNGIYKITNKLTNKIYIGQSRNITNRWQEHIDSAFDNSRPSYNYPLQKDIREYGISNFYFEILETDIYDQDTLNLKEFEYIKYYDSYNKGYNQNSGIGPEKIEIKKTWTQKEVESLKNLIKKGLSYEEIGKQLNRSEKSINTKASRLKIGPRAEHSWTPEINKKLIQLRNEGKSQAEAGKILGFTKEAVKKHWHDFFSEKEGKWK